MNKNDPPFGCGFLGPVKGSTLIGDLSDAHGDILRNAVLSGGNYVAVDIIERPVVLGIGGYTVRGRLFICPKREPPPAAPTTVFEAPRGPVVASAPGVVSASAPVVAGSPAATDEPGARAAKTSGDVTSSKAATCEPDCGSGYTCLRAVCVSVCNPGCGAGEQCGADRVCRAGR